MSWQGESPFIDLPRCESGKICYDKKTAQTKANYLGKGGGKRRKGGKMKVKGGLRIYPCPECNWWHLSHINVNQSNRPKLWRKLADHRF